MSMCRVALGNHKSLTKQTSSGFSLLHGQALKEKVLLILFFQHSGGGRSCREGWVGFAMCSNCLWLWHVGLCRWCKRIVGWSRRKWVAEAGGSVRGFNRKNKPLKRSALMLWQTLRQEVRWCDDFMAWCLSSGLLSCGIALGQRKIKWFVFFLISAFCCFPSSVDTGAPQWLLHSLSGLLIFRAQSGDCICPQIAVTVFCVLFSSHRREKLCELPTCIRSNIIWNYCHQLPY